MTRVTVDPSTEAKLAGARETLEVCSTAGELLGHFVPTAKAGSTRKTEPTISEEELSRREQQGGGRPLAAILADLERRG
jgi:hypothetical protein